MNLKLSGDKAPHLLKLQEVIMAIIKLLLGVSLYVVGPIDLSSVGWSSVG